MWPDQPLKFIVLENDSEGIHFGLFEEFELVGVISLFIEGNSAQFRKFAVIKEKQGKGYGTLLLDHLINFVKKQKKLKRIWCNARSDKTSFYERFGMEETPNTFVKASIHYTIMDYSF